MPRKRVLMIAHQFPPAGGSGSNRSLAFAKYLCEYGWEPVVVTTRGEWAMNRDDALAREVPDGVRVVRTRSLEKLPPPLGQASSRGEGVAEQSLTRASRDLSQRKRWLRSHLGHLKRFPDAHIGWLPFALAASRAQDYDVAYSSSGPFTNHLVGLLLKRLTRRPWVAELRDGWYRWNRAIFPDYPVWRDRLERRLETSALESADRVILVTERMASAFRCQYPHLDPDHFAVVSNGFDASQFSHHPADLPQQFEVLHTGALYYGRSLDAFLEAVSALIRTDPEFAAAFRLKLFGSLDAIAWSELRRHHLEEQVSFLGQLHHGAVLETMRKASLLLLVANTTPGAEATVPGKLFEYLAAGRPILAIAPPDSSTADVLRQTGGGWLAPAGDVGGITCVLRQAFSAHRAGESVRADASQVARFDRRVLTGTLAEIFEQVHARRN